MINNKCGVFFEIHKNQSNDVIQEYKYDELLSPEEYDLILMNIEGLCSDAYEIWYIIKALDIKYI